MKFIRAKSSENISSPDISQDIFIYRVNYMLDVDIYYVPIFMHTAICAILSSCLIVTFDVLYLTMIENCCGLFAAARWVLRNSIDLRYPDLSKRIFENIRCTDSFLRSLVIFLVFLFIFFFSNVFFSSVHCSFNAAISFSIRASIQKILQLFICKFLILTLTFPACKVVKIYCEISYINFCKSIELHLHHEYNKASA